MTTKILITGGQGQLGQSFSWLTRQAQLPATVQVRLASRQELDICDSLSIDQALQVYQPDVLINAAAYTAVDRAESEPELAYAINATAVAQLAQACDKYQIRLVQVSTDYVFDGQADHAYAETEVTNPTSVYGQTKLAGEQAALQYVSDATILRTSWVFSQFGNNFLKTMLRLGAERDTLSVVSDQVGGPSYAPYIAQVLLDLAVHPQARGIYHFAGTPHVSWYEFAQAIFRCAQEQQILERIPTVHPIPTTAYPTPARRPAQSGLSMYRLEQLGIHGNSNWLSGIQSSLDALYSES